MEEVGFVWFRNWLVGGWKSYSTGIHPGHLPQPQTLVQTLDCRTSLRTNPVYCPQWSPTIHESYFETKSLSSWAFTKDLIPRQLSGCIFFLKNWVKDKLSDLVLEVGEARPREEVHCHRIIIMLWQCNSSLGLADYPQCKLMTEYYSTSIPVNLNFLLQDGACLPRWRISSWFFRGEHEDTLFSLSPECCLTRRGGE